ncbi:hypothetical protein GO599_04215 [Sulfolobus islandicus]|uniref:Uncharacterized protein n=1 Tax=Saccharolobus islandicus (strain HVE10/4) TaxID=930943 RepID=F0NND3_SACI0|nr:hypothetical protein [Sulfolobus islandicus]ADX81891.1 hypothetical protein SiH_0528 [Sulfolobus islandicus HVE10/4]WCM36759.1 hypothetical protein GO599_04215 [Sulfolobus islandicus]
MKRIPKRMPLNLHLLNFDDERLERDILINIIRKYFPNFNGNFQTILNNIDTIKINIRKSVAYDKLIITISTLIFAVTQAILALIPLVANINIEELSYYYVELSAIISIDLFAYLIVLLIKRYNVFIIMERENIIPPITVFMIIFIAIIIVVSLGLPIIIITYSVILSVIKILINAPVKELSVGLAIALAIIFGSFFVSMLKLTDIYEIRGSLSAIREILTTRRR